MHDIHPKAIIKDNVVNYEAILKIEQDGLDLLRPEMTANVIITTNKKKGVLAIPKKAVKRKGKKKFIAVKAGKRVIEKAVNTGWRDGKYMEILSGVKEGDFIGIPVKPPPGKNKKRRRRS